MLQDMLTLPTTGGALLAGAAYAALSVFVTGPLVAERTIDKSGWPGRCASQGLTAAMPEPPQASSRLCGDTLGAVYGKDGEAFCARYGDSLTRAFDLLGSLPGQYRADTRAKAAEQAAAGSRCLCATQTVLGERQIDFAIYAGTARLVSPLSVRSLDAELTRAFHAPACTTTEGERR